MRGLWSHLERLGGGIGTRGPGETQIETDRRLARDRIAVLRSRLEHVKGSRATQRAERERAAAAQRRARRLHECRQVHAPERAHRRRGRRARPALFNTLDPTTRMLDVAGRHALLSDTVGFISKLPHEVVDAFTATLEETQRADLLLHVLDASAPEQQAAVMQRSVEATLDEIGAGERPRLLVLNKIDLLDEADRDELRFRHPDAVLVSGQSGSGLDELLGRIDAELQRTLRPVELLVPYADGGCLSELHRLAGDLTRQDTPEGVRVRALVPARLADRFARFAVSPHTAGSAGGL